MRLNKTMLAVPMMMLGLTAGAVGFAPGWPDGQSPAGPKDDKNPLVVTAMFGAGINTIPPLSNPENHHVIPEAIHVKTGGVVNFVVAGFHQIFVYNPGVRPWDIVVPQSGTFVDDLRNLYYQGIVPAGGSGNIPVTTNPSNAQNRVEPVYFSQPGTYLVICNVRGHFLTGMYAWVVVSDHPGDDHGNH